ncbi:hypothetical protein GOBAR_AA09420 [Gossypium barbadense]|uniref:Uncharacterized protein n=1 Tax=Gossypium barbadense TaxID=3634 RepID=A0A2P5Y6L1_GOSBA|nr:hypothetical protein GOBAR_AA09420 [Gossypium barbadense]
MEYRYNHGMFKPLSTLPRGETICMGDDSNSDDFLSSKSDSTDEDCLEKRGVEQPRLENTPIENGDRL